MRLPFAAYTVKEIIGDDLVLSKNSTCSPLFYPAANVTLEDGGGVAGFGKWETMDGTLRILDKRGGLSYEFRGLETRNGVVYAVGMSVLSMSRVTIHKKVPLLSGFGVCVSSHVAYEKEALPVLFTSLKNSGFDTEKVLVVVGGESDAKKNGIVTTDPNFGARIIRKDCNFLGFTALTEHAHMESSPYWMLLHDTCSVEKSFTAKMSSVDVGLSPDIVLLRSPQEKLEIGIYSSKFLHEHMDTTLSSGLLEYLNALTMKANVAVVLNALADTKVEKDIYGTGVKRETLLFSSLGILKYRGKAMDGGKP